MGEKKIGSLIVTITLLAARLQHLANPSKASPCYWVPARGCLIVSNWFQARISRNKQFISSHLAVISRDQQAIGVSGPSCRQRRCVCPAKSKASAFKGAINTIKIALGEQSRFTYLTGRKPAQLYTYCLQTLVLRPITS